MARPRRSTREEFIDTFSDFDIETQEHLIEVCGVLYRQNMRKRKGKKEPAVDVEESQATLPLAAQKENING